MTTRYHKVVVTEKRVSSQDLITYQGKLQYTENAGTTWTDEDGTAQHHKALIQWLRARPFVDIPTSVEEATGVINPFPDIVSARGLPDTIELDLTSLTHLLLPVGTVIGAIAAGRQVAVSNYAVKHVGDRTQIDVTSLTGFYRFYLTKTQYITYTVANLNSEKKLTVSGVWGIHGIERTDGTIDHNWASISYVNNSTVIQFPSNVSTGGKLLVSPMVLVGAQLGIVERLYVTTEYPINLVNSLGVLQTTDYVVANGKININVSAYQEQYVSLLIPEFMLQGTPNGYAELIVNTNIGASGVGITYDNKMRMVGLISPIRSVTEAPTGTTPTELGIIKIIKVTDLPSINMANPDTLYRVESTRQIYQLNLERTAWMQVAVVGFDGINVSSQYWTSEGGKRFRVTIDDLGGFHGVEVV